MSKRYEWQQRLEPTRYQVPEKQVSLLDQVLSDTPELPTIETLLNNTEQVKLDAQYDILQGVIDESNLKSDCLKGLSVKAIVSAYFISGIVPQNKQWGGQKAGSAHVSYVSTGCAFHAVGKAMGVNIAGVASAAEMCGLDQKVVTAFITSFDRPGAVYRGSDDCEELAHNLGQQAWSAVKPFQKQMRRAALGMNRRVKKAAQKGMFD